MWQRATPPHSRASSGTRTHTHKAPRHACPAAMLSRSLLLRGAGGWCTAWGAAGGGACGGLAHGLAGLPDCQQARQGEASTSGSPSTSAIALACGPSSSIWSQRRCFSAEPAPATSSTASTADADLPGNPRVHKLAEELLALSVLESSWLSAILRKRLDLPKPTGAMPFPVAMGAAAPVAPAAAAPAAAGAGAAAKAAEPAKEKTEFDVKLEAFSADGKIKVIKEVRVLTNLGLKEAKELVRAHGRAGVDQHARGGRACMRVHACGLQGHARALLLWVHACACACARCRATRALSCARCMHACTCMHTHARIARTRMCTRR